MTVAVTDYQGAGIKFTGAANSDTATFTIRVSGRYALKIYSSGTASVVLNVATPSGNYVACGDAVTTTGLFDLPPGDYQLAFGSSAGTADGALSLVRAFGRS